MINSLSARSFNGNEKLEKAYQKMQQSIVALNEKELPEDLISSINEKIELINRSNEEPKALKKLITKKHREILELVRKETGFVPKGYYRNQWMALGMTVFGLPIGMAIGVAIGNIGLMGAFLPIGMAIGLAIGLGMDNNAAAEGKQLNIG